MQRGGTVGSALRLAIAPRGGLFGPARAIATPTNVSQPSIAIAPGGDAIFAWRASLPAGGEQDADAPILASVRTRTDRATGSQAVSVIPGSDPQVRTNRQGEAVLA